MTHAFFFKRQAITFWKICAFQELLGIILIIEYLVDNKSSNLSSQWFYSDVLTENSAVAASFWSEIELI